MIDKDLCVEGLKLFKPHHIEALFGDEDYIVMLQAELSWEDLGGRDQYIFKNPNPNLNNSTEKNSDPASSGSTASPSTNKKKTNVMHKNRRPSVFKFGFSKSYKEEGRKYQGEGREGGDEEETVFGDEDSIVMLRAELAW